MPTSWTLRPASGGDAGWLSALKAQAMRADLERLGYWDEEWAKSRFVETFVPANTSVILVDGTAAGCIAVRREPDAYWLEHFYLYAWAQGSGVGGQVLTHVLREQTEPLPCRLAIDRGSAVQRLYERHGFRHVWDDANGVDQVFERAPGG